MDIEIWADLTCPFCYMASHNFESALEEFPHAKELNIIWRSFELEPDAPSHFEGNQYSLLADKYDKTEQEIIEMTQPVVKEGASIGLTFNFDTAKPVNTFDAHRLLHLAEKYGKQKEIRNKLYKACFTEGKNISDPDTLLTIGVQGGLNKTDIKKMLRSDSLGDLVRRDEKKAQDANITGVPQFLIDGKHSFRGNRKPEQYTEELINTWDEKHADNSLEKPKIENNSGNRHRCET